MHQRAKLRTVNWFFFIIIAIIGYFGAIIISQQYYLMQVGRDQILADERLSAATAEHERLREERNKLDELFYIEKLAREELGMTAMGELPYAPKKYDAE